MQRLVTTLRALTDRLMSVLILSPNQNNTMYYITYQFNETAILTVLATKFGTYPTKTDGEDRIEYTGADGTRSTFLASCLISIVPYRKFRVRTAAKKNNNPQS